MDKNKIGIDKILEEFDEFLKPIIDFKVDKGEIFNTRIFTTFKGELKQFITQSIQQAFEEMRKDFTELEILAGLLKRVETVKELRDALLRDKKVAEDKFLGL